MIIGRYRSGGQYRTNVRGIEGTVATTVKLLYDDDNYNNYYIHALTLLANINDKKALAESYLIISSMAHKPLGRFNTCATVGNLAGLQCS